MVVVIHKDKALNEFGQKTMNVVEEEDRIPLILELGDVSITVKKIKGVKGVELKTNVFLPDEAIAEKHLKSVTPLHSAKIMVIALVKKDHLSPKVISHFED